MERIEIQTKNGGIFQCEKLECTSTISIRELSQNEETYQKFLSQKRNSSTTVEEVEELQPNKQSESEGDGGGVIAPMETQETSTPYPSMSLQPTSLNFIFSSDFLLINLYKNIGMKIWVKFQQFPILVDLSQCEYVYELQEKIREKLQNKLIHHDAVDISITSNGQKLESTLKISNIDFSEAQNPDFPVVACLPSMELDECEEEEEFEWSNPPSPPTSKSSKRKSSDDTGTCKLFSLLLL